MNGYYATWMVFWTGAWVTIIIAVLSEEGCL